MTLKPKFSLIAAILLFSIAPLPARASAQCMRLVSLKSLTRFQVLTSAEAIYYRNFLKHVTQSQLSPEELARIAPRSLRYSRHSVDKLRLHIQALPKSFKEDIIDRVMEKQLDILPHVSDTKDFQRTGALAFEKLNSVEFFEGPRRFLEASIDDILLSLAINKGRIAPLASLKEGIQNSPDYLIMAGVGAIIGVNEKISDIASDPSLMLGVGAGAVLGSTGLATWEAGLARKPLSSPEEIRIIVRGSRAISIDGSTTSLSDFIIEHTDNSPSVSTSVIEIGNYRNQR